MARTASICLSFKSLKIFSTEKYKNFLWTGRESDPRPPLCKSGILPLNYRPLNPPSLALAYRQSDHMIEEIGVSATDRRERLGQKRFFGQTWQAVRFQKIEAVRRDDKIRPRVVPQAERLMSGNRQLFN